ncbi:ligase-associated DNA damage response endonuclease PdeM [Acuticoccus sp. MNP-M23]|uniref:ligase-associated DNA damage response endonuclease PdeM n=1 Tax=Acuticoccus sp. MNP-M23 TaxID=3072793 RepID=UPI0028168F8F|nr:ligase-associated DNA damage response endonuclease PdeM [Acuticoccus sp. MNP-M23]WMS42996.1 ligase-associated DNA damage response endonuclease PdeM [Acuticoccus sp. MNP-M23]
MSSCHTGYGMAAMAAFSLPGPKKPGPVKADERPPTAPARLAGMEATLDTSGALYWAAEETLVVSDLHLETGSSYARSGQMLPPYDTGLTLARLADAIAHHRPRRLISLGDSFHDPYGPERLSPTHRNWLADLCQQIETVWITGNHDHASAASFGGTAAESATIAGITFRHIPTEGPVDGMEVAGHLHPAGVVILRNRRIKRRAFIGCARRMVMPAFGVLTGGLPHTDAAFAGLWPKPLRPQLHLIGRQKIHSL